jgi:hypothetical protein
MSKESITRIFPHLLKQFIEISFRPQILIVNRVYYA